MRDRLTLAAVLGAGVVVGVSGLYMYFKFHNCVGRELTHLTRTIESLRKDIEELKASSAAKTRAASGVHRTWSGDRAEPSSSAVAANSEEFEEYFDVSDEGDHQSQTWATMNGEITSQSEDLSPFLEEIDGLLKGDNGSKREAYDKLMLKKDDNDTNAEFMWRLARACNMLATLESDAEKKKKYIFDGVKYASVALMLNEDSGETHKWYAVLMGKTTDHVGIQEKINNGYAVIQHVNKAIELKPDDHHLYYLKGRWCYGVAMLSWIERKVATTLYGEMPSSTFAEALEQFMEVEKRIPGQWRENMLYIAKCLIADKKYAEAIEWLDKAVQTTTPPEEEEIEKEIILLQQKYQGYRKK